MSPEQVRGLPVDHALGHLLLRRDPLRAALRQEGVQARHGERHDRRDHEGRAARADAVGPQRLARARPHRAALPGEGPREPLPDREGRRVRAVGGVGADDRASRAGRTSSRRRARGPGRRSRRRRRVAAVLAVAALLLWTPAPRTARPPPPAAHEPGVRRVAVLPFENLGAPEDDYFADGIADAIRGKLTSLPGLEVIARGSSTPYKKTTKTPQEIAKELDANYLLTATVRWQKGARRNRVQVSPELVEVRESGAPTSRWQQPFDAAMTDVFQVQSDIATRVAKELGVALGDERGEEPRGQADAEPPGVRGVPARRGGVGRPVRDRSGHGAPRRSPSTSRRSRSIPAFVEAWMQVSIANSLLYANGVPTPEVSERARQAAEKAIALAPNGPMGYRALGTFRRLVLNDFTGSLELYRKAQATCAGGRRRASGDGLFRAGSGPLGSSRRALPSSGPCSIRAVWAI